MGKLNARKVSTLTTPGMHGDGDGLYLNVSQSGSKSWILRVRVLGETQRREIGLGALAHLPLAAAREKCRQLRAEAKAGRNPAALRDKKALTFEDAAIEHHKELSPSFKSGKHADIWLASLRNHVFPVIGNRKVEAIARDDVLRVLSPIWTDKNDTARRVKQRIASTLDWAICRGHLAGANPVDGALQRALPKVRRRVEHHAALPWQEVPSFMSDLSERTATAARCLELAILTATRSAEVRGAEWSEFDLSRAVWTIPPSRMKVEEEHRIPLSPQAVTIVAGMQGLDDRLVFPSPQAAARGEGKPLSVNAFRPLFARMNREGLTAHGFRSSFRDWCAERAHADRAVAEAALAHKVRGVEGAYLRSDFFERRRDLMGTWGRFCCEQSDRVVELARA